MTPAVNGERAGGVTFPLGFNEKENHMRLLGKTAIVAGLAGAMALGSMTASQARFRAGPAAAAGFVAGAALGAAAANSGYYGYNAYAYDPGYSGYAYEPAYTPPSYYGPVTPSYSYGYSYDTNNTGPWHERQLQGRDW